MSVPLQQASSVFYLDFLIVWEVKLLSQYVQNGCFIAFGANVAGCWGEPLETLNYCLSLLEAHGFRRLRTSAIYKTHPEGLLRQPDYVNVVMECRCDHMPRNIIGMFKTFERLAGRKSRVRNGPRPLDLDLLSYRSWVVNWPPPRPRPALVLPHPLITERPFVLAPLADLAPAWRHPVFGLTARSLLACHGRRTDLERRGTISRLEFPADL